MPPNYSQIADTARVASQNAGTMQQSQASAYDVWTHSYEGLSDRIAHGDVETQEQIDRAIDAGISGEWARSGLDGLGAGFSQQAGEIANQFKAIGSAQGALATVGATFAFLTGIEQFISVLASAIPFPALPAIRITDMDIGLPHAHSHPPNLVPPAPPVPLPSTGPVIPIPMLSGANTVLINGMPAARCGDMGLGIWCGGYFPMYEVFLGSSNVWLEGCRAGRIGVDITKHCIFTYSKAVRSACGPDDRHHDLLKRQCSYRRHPHAVAGEPRHGRGIQGFVQRSRESPQTTWSATWT